MTETARLNLDDLAPQDRELELNGSVFPIRGRLPIMRDPDDPEGIPGLVELLRIETRINSSGSGEEFANVLAEAARAVHKIIAERTPDVPFSVVANLTEDQVLEVLGWLAGDESVAQAVAEAVAPPAAGDDVEGQPVEARTAEEIEAEGDSPLASRTSSPSPSSGSAESTAGPPATGETPASTPASSEPTPAQPTPVG